MTPEESLLPVSAVNQFVYCPRRCALIHSDGVFAENAATLEGRFAHERADTPGAEEREGVRVVRALPIFSRRLGLVGKADIVEFHAAAGGEAPYPVDYKRGPRRSWGNDDAQLCAQALCLEEMLGVRVPRGAIFHIVSRRRREVEFTPDLRAATEEAVAGARALLGSGALPGAVLSPRCDGCSLRPSCLPEAVADPGRIARYLAGLEADFEGGA